jgi:hypothetical protein
MRRAEWTACLIMPFLLAAACQRPLPPSARVSFEEMTAGARVLPAASDLRSPVSALATDDALIVVDQDGPNLKVFDRAEGSLRGVVGGPGDGPGEFRRPLAIVPLDSGRYAIFDQGKRVLSIRDARGVAIGETAPLKGFFNGVVALPRERRVLLSGTLFGPASEESELHEFDYSGRRLASYAERERAASGWEAKFGAVFAAQIGRSTVIGTLSSNRLRVYDRRTHTARWMDVAPDWYHPLAWPSDRLLVRGASSQSVSRVLANWMRTQRLMNAVFPLSGGRLLVRFVTIISPHDHVYYYALADTMGRTTAVSRATRARMLATRGDTMYWALPNGGTGWRLMFGVLNGALAAPGGTVTGMVARR